MPPSITNAPLPPKRTDILPFKGKYFCCNNLPLHALESIKADLDKETATKDGSQPRPGPITSFTNHGISAAQTLVHFLEWAKHYYDCTAPLISNREMNIDAVTWFVQVKELKSRVVRSFFPELGSTPITGITYSFLEAAVEDLTFPNKEVEKLVVREIICPYPKKKKYGKCAEHSAPHGLRKGRAFEISAWVRRGKKVEVKEEEKIVEQEKVKCVVPKETDIPTDSDNDANNEDSDEESRAMDLKALKEMLIMSDKVEKRRAAKDMMAARKGKGKAKEEN